MSMYGKTNTVLQSKIKFKKKKALFNLQHTSACKIDLHLFLCDRKWHYI